MHNLNVNAHPSVRGPLVTSVARKLVDQSADRTGLSADWGVMVGKDNYCAALQRTSRDVVLTNGWFLVEAYVARTLDSIRARKDSRAE